VTPAGDRWLSYIPIRLPSTICVRERVPSGAVAVLINRAHAFHDLVLTVDAVEDQWFLAIDGTRTIAEILDAAPRDGRDPGRALSFFERLRVGLRPGSHRQEPQRRRGQTRT
jgi:hypothetical protein